jgi:hypothetical protein
MFTFLIAFTTGYAACRTLDEVLQRRWAYAAKYAIFVVLFILISILLSQH